MEEVNGYKRRGAWQTAGIVAATGSFLLTVFSVVFIPIILAKADEKFEERLRYHKASGRHYYDDRRMDALEKEQALLREKIDKLVTKDDLDRFLKRLDQVIYGDSGRLTK